MPKSNKRREPDVPRERAAFTSLLAVNPNYFGNLAEVPFEPVLPKTADSTYEELTCVAYQPARAELEATLAQKLGGGYGGGPCSAGSREYVRFYVDEGGGWTDAGIAGVHVTNVAVTDDCADQPTHPLHHTVTVGYAPRRRPCTDPKLVRVRAILSWNIQPPPSTPDHKPVWGSVLECTIQIAPARRFPLSDLIDRGKLLELLELPAELTAVVDQPIKVPVPPEPPLETLAQRYRKEQVEPHRFALKHALAATSGEAISAEGIQAAVTQFEIADLDLTGILAAIGDTKGNTSYEELECVGLDNNRERLVGTFRIKRPTGFSGPLCSPGSTEYVAFWVDWDDTCEWTYAGTAEVAAHDLVELPDGGLCYAAVLPVDLEPLRRDCDEPRIARVRAVLSWNTPPSTTDPDAVPAWGNRLDTHVRVLPGATGDPDVPTTWITLIGGVNVGGIDPVTGYTTPAAVSADNGLMAGTGRPFGGRIVVRGPSLPGHTYRVEKKKASDAVWTPMTDSFQTVNEDGTVGVLVTPPPSGNVAYLPKQQNFTNLLGAFTPSGDDLWEIRLVVLGVGTSPVYRVQLDNTPPTLQLAITSGPGTCGKFPIGSTIGGTFQVTDPHLKGWSLRVPDPDPADPTNVVNQPGTAPLASPSPVPAGSPWTLDTTGMKACGYNVVLHAFDRTIRNNNSHPGSTGNQATTQVGFCLEE